MPKQIIIRTSEEMWLAIAQAALDNRISRNDLIKQALEAYLKARSS